MVTSPADNSTPEAKKGIQTKDQSKGKIDA
jgi:hypothetical protein